MDLRQFFGALRARWRILVTVTVAGLGWSAWLLASSPTMYTSSATIFVSTPPSGVTNTVVASILMQERALSYVHMATDSKVIERSVERLGGDLTTDELREDLSAEAIESTLLVVIKAKAESPERAQQVTGVVAEETLRLVKEVEGDEANGSELPIVANMASSPTRASSASEPDLVIGSAVGAALSLMTGLGAALLREVLDTSLKSVADVRAVTGSSPLAMIPAAPTDADRPVHSAERRGPLVEAFNLMRTNLQFADIEAGVRTILVTSARVEEGAPFVARNLATAMARVGRSVLLVDADLRSPSIRVSEDAGLVSVLLGLTALDDAIEVDDTGVHVLPAGPVPPNPVEVLDSAAVRDLLPTLSERYDIVVIVCSALLVYADGAALLTEVDGAVLVIPHGSSRDRLKQAASRIEQAGGRLSGVVVSGVPRSFRTSVHGESGARADRSPKSSGARRGRRARR